VLAGGVGFVQGPSAASSKKPNSDAQKASAVGASGTIFSLVCGLGQPLYQRPDPDRASVKAVEVGFNPLHLVFTRTLKLNVTLVQPDVYIEQDAEETGTTIPAAEQKPGLIKTELDDSV